MYSEPSYLMIFAAALLPTLHTILLLTFLECGLNRGDQPVRGLLPRVLAWNLGLAAVVLVVLTILEVVISWGETGILDVIDSTLFRGSPFVQSTLLVAAVVRQRAIAGWGVMIAAVLFPVIVWFFVFPSTPSIVIAGSAILAILAVTQRPREAKLASGPAAGRNWNLSAAIICIVLFLPHGYEELNPMDVLMGVEREVPLISVLLFEGAFLLASGLSGALTAFVSRHGGKGEIVAGATLGILVASVTLQWHSMSWPGGPGALSMAIAAATSSLCVWGWLNLRRLQWTDPLAVIPVWVASSVLGELLPTAIFPNPEAEQMFLSLGVLWKSAVLGFVPWFLLAWAAGRIPGFWKAREDSANSGPLSQP